STKTAAETPFHIYHDSFTSILGAAPTLQLLATFDDPLFHEAGVFIPSDNTLFVTSNRLGPPNSPTIQISKLEISENAVHVNRNISDITMPNGGVNDGDSGIVFCMQGKGKEPSGLVHMSAKAPYESKTLLTTFHGRTFNSPNDVVINPRDGSIWFTDPVYGYEQGFRHGKPQLPNQVYRFERETGDIRAIADGFGRPNGICFSPDLQTVYITDTDAVHGDGTVDITRAATIYAFTHDPDSTYPTLTARRVFAHAMCGIPDGIKCDTAGNVYSGCGDGVHVWNPEGRLIGKIAVPGPPDGVANFCFGKEGQMFLLNETRIWRVKLGGKGVKGALLGV
ncbi:MAG: hypothetical protein M4579_004739, partial [Chaenotheca gracillima]